MGISDVPHNCWKHREETGLAILGLKGFSFAAGQSGLEAGLTVGWFCGKEPLFHGPSYFLDGRVRTEANYKILPENCMWRSVLPQSQNRAIRNLLSDQYIYQNADVEWIVFRGGMVAGNNQGI